MNKSKLFGIQFAVFAVLLIIAAVISPAGNPVFLIPAGLIWVIVAVICAGYIEVLDRTAFDNKVSWNKIVIYFAIMLILNGAGMVFILAIVGLIV